MLFLPNSPYAISKKIAKLARVAALPSFSKPNVNLNESCQLAYSSVQGDSPRTTFEGGTSKVSRASGTRPRRQIMTSIFTKTALGAAVAATALVSATPASAHDYYSDHDRGGDTAGAAIVGGVIGLALGAIIASSSNNHRNQSRYDRRYYNNGYNGGGYYQQGQTGYYNGYNNNGYNNNGYDNNGYNNTYRGYNNDRRGYNNNDGYYRRGY